MAIIFLNMLKPLKIKVLNLIKSKLMFLTKQTQLFFIAGLILLLFSSVNSYSYASERNLEYKVKAAYLYNFTKFINWPDDVLPGSNEKPLNICILGRDPFGHAIDLLSNKTAQGHNVFVKYIKKVNTRFQCHVVFISKSEEARIEEILNGLSNRKVLTVSDIDKFAVKGGAISLNVFNGKVSFNINLQATKNADLRVSAKLLELAKMVIE